MDHETGLARLNECREAIDRIDIQIVALINERTKVVEEIGRVKEQLAMAIYEPKREEQVMANITKHNAGPLPNDAVMRMFERIMDEMRTVQRLKMKKEGS
jgi:chorismate mutase-like protein